MTKKLSYILLAVVFALAFAACGHSKAQKAQQNMVSFVKEVQAHADQYTAEEWTDVQDQFKQLAAEVDKTWDNLNTEEQTEANEYAETYFSLISTHCPAQNQPMFEQLEEGPDISDLFE